MGTVVRFLLAPLRFAVRRPGRALVMFGFAVLLCGLIAAGGLALWFQWHLRAASEEVKLGHNAAATRHLRSCRWVFPEHRQVLLMASCVARRSGAWSEAESLLDRYWARYGDDDAVVFERLLLRTTRGDLESSVAALRHQIEADGPEAEQAREALITGLQYRFRWREAEADLDDWLSRTPDHTAALLLRGKLQEQRRQTSQALLTYRRILELDPQHDEARLRLSTLLLMLRQGEEAVSHLGYLHEALPDNPVVATEWAQALALQGRTSESRAALDDCLRDHPDHPMALAERGRYLLAAGDDQSAENDFARSLRFDPGNQATRNMYAMVLGRNGKNAEAARERERIAALEADGTRIDALISGPLQNRPDDPSIPYEIGMIALRAGQPSEALRWFQNSLQVGPNYLPTHQVLTTYYHETGNPVLSAKHRAISQRLSGSKMP